MQRRMGVSVGSALVACAVLAWRPAHAAADPVLLRAVRALAAREANLKCLSGVVMQHEMQSAAEVAAQRALITAHMGPVPAGAHRRVAPIEQDGLMATRLAVGPGRCRFETVLFRASLDDWGASTWLMGRDGKLPVVPAAPPRPR